MNRHKYLTPQKTIGKVSCFLFCLSIFSLVQINIATFQNLVKMNDFCCCGKLLRLNSAQHISFQCSISAPWKPKVFWRFQVVQIWNIGGKWVKMRIFIVWNTERSRIRKTSQILGSSDFLRLRKFYPMNYSHSFKAVAAIIFDRQ